MANANAPTGLQPARHVSGGEIRLADYYTIASGYNATIGRGHPVELTGTAKNIQLSAKTNVNSIGVFWGVSYTDSSGSPVFKPYWPANTTATNIKAYVYDDPNIEYEIQADSCTSGHIGALADWTAGTASTITGLSGCSALVSGATAASNLGLRIVGLVDRVDNAYGAYAKIRVSFAEHARANVIAGVGGV